MTDAIRHTEPARIKANGIELVYDCFGEPDAPPILLIMGLGAQMIDWKDDFCAQLAGRGFRVIRFDNRDVGQSTLLEEAGQPSIAAMIEAMQRGETVTAPYLLSDLMADTIGLLDAIGVGATHVVGLSMGGMIAQLMAANHQDRVLSLTSIMSTTGEPGLPASTPEAWACLTAPLETELGPYLEQYIFKWQVYSGPRYPIDVSLARDHASRLYARGVHTAGRDRQLAAILASGSRREALASVSCPALVIHGDSDPVVRIEAAIATANAIEGAELLVFEGMGHDLAKGLWPEVVDAIARHASRGSRQSSSSS
ncbi:MAG: alpha/beta hydrolase [Holophagae bacterium]|nr:MAG: alpha/beta hydrolase [Holophagae bacterium]